MNCSFLRALFLILLLAIPSGAATASPEGAVEQSVEASQPGAEHSREETHGEGGEHETKTYFGIPAWILQLANIMLFIGVLVYLLKGPVGGSLEQRRQRIREELTQAEQHRIKSDQLAHDIEARLTQIESEVASILERARVDGERQKVELIAAGDTEAAKILQVAKNEIDARVKSARQELTAYAGELATRRASELVAQSLTDADRRTLFEEGVQEMSGRQS